MFIGFSLSSICLVFALFYCSTNKNGTKIHFICTCIWKQAGGVFEVLSLGLMCFVRMLVERTHRKSILS